MDPKSRLAFVLCAGVGRRLQPLTLRYPKALLPVRGRPMVFHVLDALRRHGVRRFVVNLHAHPSILRRELLAYGRRHRVRFAFFHEKTLLDTGGALRNAKKILSEPFWLVNCDFFPAKFSFAAMERAHVRRRALATLAVRPLRAGESYNPVGVDSRGRLVRVSRVYGCGGQDRVFLGVHQLEPESLEFLSGKKIFGVFEGLYRNLFLAGRPVSTYRDRSAPDVDLGTLEGYFSANFTL